jgi:hypothetical protein
MLITSFVGASFAAIGAGLRIYKWGKKFYQES